MSENDDEQLSPLSRYVEKTFTIWLHSQVVNAMLHENLSSYANIVTFVNVDNNLIESKKGQNETIFVIISNDEHGLSQIQKLEQVDSIFIFSSNNSIQSWQQRFKKIKGVFSDTSKLSRRILFEIKRVRQDFIPISIFPSSIESSDLDHLDASFMYIKLLKDIFIDMKLEKEKRKSFLDYCGELCPGAASIKEMVKELVSSANRTVIIKEYTSTSSFYPILNQALRDMHIESLLLLGFIIHDLYWELEERYFEPENVEQEEFIVYRGQNLYNVEWNRVTIGSLFCFNSFLSTSRDREVAHMFADSARTIPDHTAILFEMHIDPKFTTHRFADIKNISTFNDEREVLFSMQAIFHIDSINLMPDGIQHVRLTLTDDDDPKLRNLTEYMKRELNGPTPMHKLGQLLINLEEWSKAKQIYKTLLEETEIDDKREQADLHHQLGYIANELESPEDAMNHYQQVIKLESDMPEIEHYRQAPTYSCIANIFFHNNDLDKALFLYKKAIGLALTQPNVDKIDVVNYYTSLGNVFRRQHHYNRALSMFQKALHNAFEVGLPSTHPDLADIYTNFGIVYNCQGHYEKAVENFKKCLNIQLHSLPHNHPSVISSYISVAETLENNDCIEEAIKYVEKACQLTKDSEKKRTYEEYISELRLILQA